MSFNIFAPDFIRIGILTTHVESIWTEYYNSDIGRASIWVVDTPENIRLLQVGCFIHRPKTDTAMEIQYVKRDSTKNLIELHCINTLSLLDKRIVLNVVNVTNAEAGMYKMVTDNLRGLPNIVTAPAKSLSEQFVTQVGNGQVLEEIRRIAIEANLGLRMVFDYRNKRHVFTIYKGADKTVKQAILQPVVFRDDFSSLEDMVFVEDDTLFKNVAYVRGAGEGAERKVVIVGTATGADRFELDVDARDLQREEGITETQYESNLRARGMSKLNDHLKIQTFEGLVPTAGFNRDYTLGDMISCKSTRYGVQLDTRISAFEEAQLFDKQSLRLTFGNPQIKLLQVVKL